MLKGGVARRFFKLSGLVPILVCNVSSFALTKLERLRITFTANVNLYHVTKFSP